MFANVLIVKSNNKYDLEYTYEIDDKARVGSRVLVPFGKGNRRVEGLVTDLATSNESGYEAKKVISILTPENDIPADTMKLIKMLKEYYVASHGEVLRSVIPDAIRLSSSDGKMKSSKKLLDFMSLSVSLENAKEHLERIPVSHSKKRETLNTLIESYPEKKKVDNKSSAESLQRDGIIEIKKEEVYRESSYHYSEVKRDEFLKLSSLQMEAYKLLGSEPHKNGLLLGVTGSGKTEIYMHLMRDVLLNEQTVIFLVPEISLVPQTMKRLRARFGDIVGTYHHKMSQGEKFDEISRMKSGKIKIVVGARSAVFSPLSNLGMIIIDESHEDSYKSDSDLKYDARKVSEMLGEIHGAKVIYGSASPSIEGYSKAISGDMMLATLNERVKGYSHPEIVITDMRAELESGNRTVLGRELRSSMRQVLSKGDKVLLMLNRIGYSSFVSCRSCGYIMKCDHCDISMTYHDYLKKTQCKYCGRIKRVPDTCPECGSKYFKQFGSGTEKLEKLLKEEFAGYRIIRMDSHSMRGKESLKEAYDRIASGDYDIILGTQIISKGLDVSGIRLVGVISADINLNLPDYKAPENTYQLLLQVSGRNRLGGKTIIQTYSPENYAISHAAKGNFRAYAADEMDLRKIMGYPPYRKLVLVTVSSANEDEAIRETERISLKLKDSLPEAKVSDAHPAVRSRVRDMYRQQVMIKYEEKEHPEVSRVLMALVHEYRSKKVRIDINVDPVSTM